MLLKIWWECSGRGDGELRFLWELVHPLYHTSLADLCLQLYPGYSRVLTEGYALRPELG